MAGRRSPYVFDGMTIKLRSQEPSFTDHFVIAARAQQCYPYSYFGFSPYRKKSTGEAGAGSGSTAHAVPGAAGASRRRAHSTGAPVRATFVDPAYRTDDACKVCEIVAFTSARDEAVWTSSDDSLKHKRVVSVTQQGKITFVGAAFTPLSKVPTGTSEDILIFLPAKCTPEQTAAFDKRKQYLDGHNYRGVHPGDISYSDLLFSPDESLGLWLGLRKIARDTMCDIEMVSTHSSGYRVYLCCKTPADAQTLKKYLKDTGLIPAVAAP